MEIGKLIFNTFVVSLLFTLAAMSDVMSNSQAILVNVQGCVITSKAIIDGSPCNLFEPTRTPITAVNECPSTLATLFIPPSKYFQMSPKVLLIIQKPNAESPRKSAFLLSAVDIPFSANENHTQPSTAINTADFSGQELQRLQYYYNVNHHELIGFLYDYTNLHVYILMKKGGRAVCDVYLLIIGGEKLHSFRTVFLYTIEVHSTFSDASSWSSNPYRGTFFYQKNVEFNGDKVTELYAIPFNHLVLSLKSGEPGVMVSRVLSTKVSLQVTADLIYTTTPDGLPLFISLKDPSEVETCLNARVSNNSVLAVRGWEFCKLRDGIFANKTECDAEQFVFKNEAIIFRVKLSYVLAATAILFISALVLVLLCIRCRILNARGIRNNYNFSTFMTSRDDDLLDNTL